MQGLVLMIIAFCITFCIMLAKVYFTCLIGISSFITTNNAQNNVQDSVVINMRGKQNQNLSKVSYVSNLSSNR